VHAIFTIDFETCHNRKIFCRLRWWNFQYHDDGAIFLIEQQLMHRTNVSWRRFRINAWNRYSGHQDNGTNVKVGSSYWQGIGGDGMDCFIDKTNNNICSANYIMAIFIVLQMEEQVSVTLPWNSRQWRLGNSLETRSCSSKYIVAGFDQL